MRKDISSRTHFLSIRIFQTPLSSEPNLTYLHIMFSRLAAVSALAFAVRLAAAASGNCNTGSMQCCQHVEDVCSSFSPCNIKPFLDADNDLAAVEIRLRVGAVVGARYQRAGRDRQDRSAVLAALGGRCGCRQWLLRVACMLSEQQRCEYPSCGFELKRVVADRC